MGCKQSKPEAVVVAPQAKRSAPPEAANPPKAVESQNSVPKDAPSQDKSAVSDAGKSLSAETASSAAAVPVAPKEVDKQAAIFSMLLEAQVLPSDRKPDSDLANRILAVSGSNPAAVRYQNPATQATPLHLAVQLLDESEGPVSMSGTDILSVIEGLVQAYPDAVQMKDASGNIPLHYAISPVSITSEAQKQTKSARDEAEAWGPRSAVLQLLLTTDIEFSMEYLVRNDVIYGDEEKESGGVTPLYRAIQALPDDFEPFSVTYEFISILRDACGEMVGVGNNGDGDKPLALLYRRFTRQFDLAEKFFDGDNSRQEVVDHRYRYKTAAANTWKIIECLLRPDTTPNGSSPSILLSKNSSKKQPVPNSHEWRLVHRAVQVETPPDLLRYIVETNAEDLTKPDAQGNLPLHYAAKSKPSDRATATAFPSFYTKYVVDELLYKFPEAASMTDADGKYPFTLAVEAGKHWIGGGIKSLYDAYPGALEQVNLEEHETLRTVLSEDMSTDPKEEKLNDSVIRDEHHDAIMLVQQEDVDIAEVITSMWAHEEDAGVQMLACVAISRIVRERGSTSKHYLLRIALSAVAAVVNAMKAHPNEVIVQEKACEALKCMAATDGMREISFVASGAVAAIVGAMQAHVSDPSVQEEACGAITEIIKAGGSDRATIVASVSGITAIVNAVAAHPDIVGVQKNAIESLEVMTSFSDANLPDLPKAQTEPLLEAAKAKFPDECGASAAAIIAKLV
uniref:Uncharacterized protein n=1 Tax=Entomoneis paludosa TaxID=265537 RepID=A0A7S2YBL7_9STRA